MEAKTKINTTHTCLAAPRTVNCCALPCPKPPTPPNTPTLCDKGFVPTINNTQIHTPMTHGPSLGPCNGIVGRTRKDVRGIRPRGYTVYIDMYTYPCTYNSAGDNISISISLSFSRTSDFVVYMMATYTVLKWNLAAPDKRV